MKILAVDTATYTGSVALLEDDRVAAEWDLQSAQTHNRRLLQTIDFLLQQTGWEIRGVDAFAVTLGPGSFTGLRIGMSTVKALAWSLRKPFVGIASLDALAAALQYASLPVCPILDARKKEVYFATYRSDANGGQIRQSPYIAAAPAQLLEHLTEPTIVCGDGWLLYREELLPALARLAIEAAAPFHFIRASFVGALARQQLLAGKAHDPLTSAPLYVRPSEAELNKSSGSAAQS